MPVNNQLVSMTEVSPNAPRNSFLLGLGIGFLWWNGFIDPKGTAWKKYWKGKATLNKVAPITLIGGILYAYSKKD